MDSKSPPGAQKLGASAGEPGRLVRALGLFDCTMIVMGCIIGAGVFQTPQTIALRMGSLEGMLAMWVLGGVIAMSGALVFAELGSALPLAGGQYVFLREGFGRFVAFLFGWLLLAAINSGAIAYVANVFVDHLQALVRYAGLETVWGDGTRRGIALGVILFLTLLNIRGVRVGANVQNAAMLAKIAGIAMIIVLGVLVLAGVAQPAVAAPEARPPTMATAWSWAGAGAALLSVMFTYGGWQNVTAVAGEVRDPERTLPRGILIGTVLVIALYIAMNWSLARILGVEGVARSATPAAAAAGAVFAWGEPLVATLVMISTFAITQALLMVTPRIYYAMACDGVFFRAAAWVHPKYKTPAVAIGLQAIASIVHLYVGKTLDLLQATTIVDFTFFTLCGLALFVLRRKRPAEAGAYRAWGYPWLPALFVLTSAAVVVSALFNAQRAAIERAGIAVGAGLLLYALWSRRATAIGGGASPGPGAGAA
jgi:basic amino acid/polyamine antiporter, APA family